MARLSVCALSVVSSISVVVMGVFSACGAWCGSHPMVVALWQYNEAKIQLLDLPGIIEGASRGVGRGRQVRMGGRDCVGMGV